MKRIGALAFSAVMILLMLTACAKSEFGLSDNTEKLMTITAQNAGKDMFFGVGSLVVEDGEEIVITSDLKKGAVRVELTGMPEEQNIDKIPDLDGPASFTADVRGSGETTGTVLPAASYFLKAVCLERATGTVRVEVKPVE